MTGNIIISEVDAFMYFVLCKAGKHMPCGELVCTTMCDIIAKVIATSSTVLHICSYTNIILDPLHEMYVFGV
jgi:hypothetical protein